MQYLLINGKSKVAIDSGAKQEDLKVFIDDTEKEFEEPDHNKKAYAQETKRKKYAAFLNNQFENLVILTGAGSSKGIGEGAQKGKLLTELWDEAETLLTKQEFTKLCEKSKYSDKDASGDYVKNLEKLLSLASIAKDFVAPNDFNIEDCIQKIKELIINACTLVLPHHAAHITLLNKVTKRKVTLPRFKLFTLNYDTLFEQAANQSNFTVIDGFSFSIPRVFSGRNFDYDIVSRHNSRVKEEDNFVPKVFHLYKMHGSTNWCQQGNQIIQDQKPSSPLMIFPNQSKYESSYEQPYFEMMSRFQSALRFENVLLICIGFSFGDKHIVTAIREAIEQNPSFQLMIVNKGIDEGNQNITPFIEAAKKHSSIMFVDELFEDFALYFPDLKSYDQEDSKKIIINLHTKEDESKSV